MTIKSKRKQMKIIKTHIFSGEILRLKATACFVGITELLYVFLLPVHSLIIFPDCIFIPTLREHKFYKTQKKKLRIIVYCMIV